MTGETLTRDLPDAASTEAMGAALAPLLRAGDTLLLQGPVGAGKTSLARALVTALRGLHGLVPEEVPSPTFTLVQTYAAGPFDIWHADLYRLSGPGGVVELGLEEAFGTALCLIEWPDRLGPDRPARAVDVTLTPTPEDGRELTLTGDPRTLARLRPAFATAAA